MVRFNDNHAAMIRSAVTKAGKCLPFAKYDKQIYPLLRAGASEVDVRIIENCLTNQINFLNSAILHYQKALETTKNILKK